MTIPSPAAMQAEVSGSVDIDAPAEAVFALVTDWPRQGEWMPRTRVRQTRGPVGLGAEVVARTSLGPLGFDDTMVVSQWDPPHAVEVLHTGRVVRGVGRFTVHPRAGGCRFTWWDRIEVPGGPLAPVLWRIAGPMSRGLFGWAVRRLRAVAERDRQ